MQPGETTKPGTPNPKPDPGEPTPIQPPSDIPEPPKKEED